MTFNHVVHYHIDAYTYHFPHHKNIYIKKKNTLICASYLNDSYLNHSKYDLPSTRMNQSQEKKKHKVVCKTTCMKQRKNYKAKNILCFGIQPTIKDYIPNTK